MGSERDESPQDSEGQELHSRADVQSYRRAIIRARAKAMHPSNIRHTKENDN